MRRCFRQLWGVDSAGRPLLALLCASARDPLLRMSAAVVLQTPIGSTVSSGDFAQAIAQAAPDRFSPKTLGPWASASPPPAISPDRLVNQGVAEVAEPGPDQEIRTLRHELETFVREGQYARGLERILSTYLVGCHS